jgi:NADP-dependent 3-hydroxy acid dehydrogenase YdfG
MYESKVLHIFSQSISPGGVKTELFEASGIPKEVLEQFKDNPYLEARDIADSVIFVLGTPPHVQVRVSTSITNISYKVLFMTIHVIVSRGLV